MPNFIQSARGSRIGQFMPFAYWAVKFREPVYTNATANPIEWMSEVDNNQFVLTDLIPFMNRQRKNTFDWTMDLVTTGDVLRIEELWLFCPRSTAVPQGSSAVLRFSPDDAGTAFHFNVTKMSEAGRIDSKIIGKVINRETHECIYHVWDGQLNILYPPMRTNINDFQAWRPGIAHLGAMSHEVIGLRL
jgi:hypothetical protein